MSFHRGPEDSHGGCGGDVLRQTVPDTSNGDRKSSVADGRQSGAADDQISVNGEDEMERIHVIHCFKTYFILCHSLTH